MCGIVGYVGKRQAQDIIYKGLSRLEYRGYDSAGIAVLFKNQNSYCTKVIKAPGKLKELKKIWAEIDFPATVGIGHTRWATHGEANQVNAHPHRSGPITIVHNGIIENHQKIREELMAKGFAIVSETDSELFGHLISQEKNRGANLFNAVKNAFQKIQGASAFVVMDETNPGSLIVVRNGSPLVVGIGEGENFVASDVPAVLEYTRKFYYLEDQEIAEISAGEVKVFSLSGQEKKFTPVQINWNIDAIDKQGFEHFMLKEIYEQPRALSDTLNSWLDLGLSKFRLDAASTLRAFEHASDRSSFIANTFARAEMIHIVACGTAAYAGYFGQQIFEKMAKISTQAEVASEFRYREPVLKPEHVGLVLSQSGETADTLAAVKLMKQAGMRVFAICNVRDSSIARECDGVMYTNAGIEVCVASTKVFTTQLALLSVLVAAVSVQKGLLSADQEQSLVEELGSLPRIAKKYLEELTELPALVKKNTEKKGFLFLGRGLYFPIALEGALKLKEVAYVHAEGYAAGELKHGPIAMVEPDMLVIAVAPEGEGLSHVKSVSNFEEVRARKGQLLSIGAASDKHLKQISEFYIPVPSLKNSVLYPILAILPLQLLAYYMALEKGTDVDQPRNLAKSVTVE